MLIFILPLASLVIIWWTVYWMGLIRVLPSPIEVAGTMVSRWRILLRDLGSSAVRIAAGFCLAMVIGIPVGLLMGTNRYVHFLLRPILTLLLPVPTLAWVPILLIMWGVGDQTIIFAIFLGGFFSIAYNTATGVRGIDQDLILAARIMGASRRELFAKVLLPGSMVSVLAGLRLAIGYSWRALVGAEMLAAASAGLGFRVFNSWRFVAVDVMFASLVIIMAIGFIMERFLVEPLERRTVKRWGMIRV
jgi:NitT/TauT family transport system permease protein